MALPSDLPIFLRSGSRIHPEMAACRQGSDGVLELGAHDCREQPGPDDLVRLRAQVHREDLREQLRVLLPLAGDLGRERRGRPGVHDVRVTDEAPWLAALVLACSRRGRRSTGRPAGGPRRRAEQAVGDDLAVVVEPVPDRERHAEETLPRDVPVPGQAFHPRLVTGPHVLGVPVELAASGEERLASLEGPHVPLRGGDDLERAACPVRST